MTTGIQDHPIAAIFPLLPEAELQELADDIKANGLKQSILACDGMILDGRNRYRACLIAGVSPHFDQYEGKDPLSVVISLNLKRRHLSESQRAMVAAKLANMPQGARTDIQHCLNSGNVKLSQSDAATLLNVSRAIVQDAKAILKESPALVAEVESGEKTIHAAKKDLPHVAHNSGENEWYTPPEYIAAAKAVVGEITLDPASCSAANKVVGAKTFYSKEDDGLQKKWRGNVWMNPPYAQPLIAQFSEKVAAEFEAGNITQACVLINNATETAFFQRMMECASAVCFPRGRIRFLAKDGKHGAPLQGQAVVYFGSRKAQFVAAFKHFGFVLCTKQ